MVYRKLLPKFSNRTTHKKTWRWHVPELPRTFNDEIFPELPFSVRDKPYRIKKTGQQPAGQLVNLSWTVTDLIRDERIIVGYNRATEVRTHVERLIVEAMRHGDKHIPTMSLANFWLHEKNLIHKLFKVIVPRYSDYDTSFTRIHRIGKLFEEAAAPISEVLAGRGFSNHRDGKVVFELKGNNLPPIVRPQLNKAGLLTNVLLDSARHRYTK